jgi:hypothetical protein
MGQGGVKEVPIHFVDKRRQICNSCEHLTTIIGVNCCDVCGCAIWSKTMVRGTSCPKEKWNAEQD